MSWTRFLLQYRASGRIKADGYDPAMFADMTAEEVGTARAMLLERGIAGDTIDLHGLRYLGDDTVVAELRAAGGRDAMRPADRDISRCEMLFVLTGDPADLRPILHHLDSRVAAERALAANCLARLDLTPVFRDALARRLVSFRHRAVALPLIQAWLVTQGVPANDPIVFHAQLPLIRRILARAWWRRGVLMAEIARSLAGARDVGSVAAGLRTCADIVGPK